MIGSSTKASLNFEVDYFQSATRYIKTIRGIFIAANILIGLIVVVRMYYFIQHNPPLVLGQKFSRLFAVRFIQVLCDEWSSIIFWFLFFVNLYFFVMYKMQTNAHLLLPSINIYSGAYEAFKVVFFITLATKTIAMIMRIIDQSNADIFLMDWEVPRKVSNEDTEESVVAWRFTFMANELDELQTELRKISPETELIWFAFFWIGLGFVDFTNMNPGLSSGNYSLQPSNILLKFFLCSIIFIIIGAVQLAIYGLRNFCSAPKIQQFTDLCSVSNISILIMTEQLHGFYINGKAPWAQSDLPLSWLKQELDRERKGKQRARDFGIQNYLGQTGQGQERLALENVTTFELYLT